MRFFRLGLLVGLFCFCLFALGAASPVPLASGLPVVAASAPLGGSFIGSLASWNWVMILGILFGLSESLSYIPSIKANGVFQFIQNGLKTLLQKAGGTPQ